MPMPDQKPHRSKQDYQTPPEFLQATKNWLGIKDFTCDLACTIDNSVAPLCVTEEDDSLAEENSWHIYKGWSWCNPPYSDIAPWVRKALNESYLGANIAMLVPASVGSNWWRDYVHRRAGTVLFLNGRLTFVGCTTPYPKDCALLLYYHESWKARGPLTNYEVWNWREK